MRVKPGFLSNIFIDVARLKVILSSSVRAWRRCVTHDTYSRRSAPTEPMPKVYGLTILGNCILSHKNAEAPSSHPRWEGPIIASETLISYLDAEYMGEPY